jgi:hypothetical protein
MKHIGLTYGKHMVYQTYNKHVVHFTCDIDLHVIAEFHLL